MIILGSKVSKESNCTSYTGSSLSNITARTNNAELKDDLKIDLGTVTVTGTCVMYFDFKFQLISHTSFSNGAVIWPGFAVQYKDEAVFALQHGVKTMSSNSPQPTLNVKVEPAQPVFDASQSKMVVRVKVSHDCLRTLAKATSAEVTIDKPPSFTYSKFTKNTGSVDVTKKAVSGLVFQIGVMDFQQIMDIDIEFTFTPSSSKQGRDLENVVFYADVKAQGSGSCASEVQDYPICDSFSAGGAIYRPFQTCDSAPGSGNDNIVYESFYASSYSNQGQPEQGKFSSPGAWQPSNSLKTNLRQYLEVRFTSLVKLRRFAVQGQCDTSGYDTNRYVKAVEVYHTVNGATWKPVMEGSHIKVFQTNRKCQGTTIVPLPYDIEAKFVRVRPVDFENAIAMKVEFYGCKSSTSVKAPPIEIPQRSMISYSDKIIVCSSGMNREIGESSCHFTNASDGQTWQALHFMVRYVAFYNKATDKLYGLGGPEGIITFQSSSTIEEPWDVIPKIEFTSRRAASGDVITLAISNDTVVINDDESSLLPGSYDVLPDVDSFTYGFSGKGVHSSKDKGSSWSLRATWW
ncbi:uncharacterized protein LOC110250399 isoform X2 [Exaiptasia diaphana]|nr:uncharacterized protein LOC110250399 isoform X2 [Exaiptasia diaphana]